MNILFIRNAGYFHSGDLKKFSDALTPLGHKLYFITRERTTNNNIKVEFISQDNTNIFTIEIEESKKNFFSSISSTLKFIYHSIKVGKKIIKEQKIDVIHAFDLDAGIVGKYLCNRYKIPYNYHILDFYIDSRSVPTKFIKKIVKKLEFKIINSAKDTIICTEERVNQIEGSRPQRLHIIQNIPNIPNLEKYLTCGFKVAGKLKIYYIGTLSNQRFIFEALNVIEKLDFCEFVIAGRGKYSAEIEERVKSIDNAKFLGEIKYEETFMYYSRAHLILACYNPRIPNHRYSAPNKIYESIALGVPIIIAKDTGNDNFVLENGIGYVINYSETDFIEILAYINENRKNLIEKHHNAKIAYQKYNWKVVELKIQELYQN